MGEHALFGVGIRRLGSRESGFFYRYPGTNETVREERVLTRIENLKGPPAWEDARIARSPSAKGGFRGSLRGGTPRGGQRRRAGDLTEDERALLELLNERLRRELSEAT